MFGNINSLITTDWKVTTPLVVLTTIQYPLNDFIVTHFMFELEDVAFGITMDTWFAIIRHQKN